MILKETTTEYNMSLTAILILKTTTGQTLEELINPEFLSIPF